MASRGCLHGQVRAECCCLRGAWTEARTHLERSACQGALPPAGLRAAVLVRSQSRVLAKGLSSMS